MGTMNKFLRMFTFGIIILSIIIIAVKVFNLSPETKVKSEAEQIIEEHKTKASATYSDYYDTDAFNLTVNKISPHFEGHDIESVYQTIEQIKSQLKKDEFETTLQYKERMEKLKDYPVLNNKKLFIGSLFAESQTATQEYDADLRQLKIYIWLILSRFGVDKTLTFENASKFEDKNCDVSYQANTTISSSFNDYFKMYMVLAGSRCEIRIKADVEEARKLKEEGIKSLIIFKLIPPYIEEIHVPRGLEYNMMTKKDFALPEKGLFAEIVDIWIYNAKTGEIIQKIKEKVKKDKVVRNGM